MGDASYGLRARRLAAPAALRRSCERCRRCARVEPASRPFSQSVCPSSGTRSPGSGKRGGVRPLPLDGGDDEDAVGGGDEALGAEELDGGE